MDLTVMQSADPLQACLCCLIIADYDNHVDSGGGYFGNVADANKQFNHIIQQHQNAKTNTDLSQQNMAGALAYALGIAQSLAAHPEFCQHDQ